MLGTLVVGLGRAGAGLHLPVLRRTRRGPFVLFDPHRSVTATPGAMVATSLSHAAVLTDPAETVVHLCTPPTARIEPMATLAELGFRRFLVEKPLAADPDALHEVLELAEAAGLAVLPVGQWRCSELTRRLRGIVASGALGPLRSATVLQHKPRFTRTVSGDDHPSAFDVELPHSVGLALTLAGPGRVTEAGCLDMVLGDAVFPALGGAWLRLEHSGGEGPHTRLQTDLTSPVRERRVTLEFDGGTVIGHFAVSAADEYAQLRVRSGARHTHAVFRDDSLAAFITRAYRHFSGEEPLADEPATGAAVVELIADAKRLAGLRVPAAALC